MTADSLRILVLSRALPSHPGSGGMEKVAWDLMTEWTAAGHTVVCATTPGSGVAAATLTAAGESTANDMGSGTVATARSAPEVWELPGTPGAYSREWFAATHAAVARFQPDIVLGVSAGAHGLVSTRSFTLRRAAASSLAAPGGAAGLPPIVMQAHGTSVNEMRGALSSRTLRGTVRAIRQVPGLIADLKRYRRYDAVVAIGANVAADIGGYPAARRPRRLELILNGTPAPQPSTARAGTRSHARRGLIFVGRMLPEKGPEVACQVAAELGQPITLIGDGSLVDQLRADYPEARILGRLTPAEVAAELREAALLVAPSKRHEGLPLVVLEALANGCPAVITPQTAQAFPRQQLPYGVHRASAADAAMFSTAAAEALQTFADAEEPQLPAAYTLASSASTYVDLFCELIEKHRGAAG